MHFLGKIWAFTGMLGEVKSLPVLEESYDKSGNSAVNNLPMSSDFKLATLLF